MRTSAIVLLLAILPITGCVTGAISADDFKQSCSQDDQCVTVREGPVCELGEPASINREELDDFEDQKQRMQANCREIASCSDCNPPSHCVDGTCQIDDSGDGQPQG